MDILLTNMVGNIYIRNYYYVSPFSIFVLTNHILFANTLYFLFYADIALIKLQKPLIGPNILNIEYNYEKGRYNFNGFQPVTIMGWGSKKRRGSGQVDHLQEAKVKAIDYHPNDMFLTLSQKNGKASCDGDSGGM